ncbi:helix-turn-helix domain-containing protein [Streptomyces sp. NPDC127108]|uniref:helix-turn-helix domain-containing protein n=1 Tax=Streptomyces sp. NPDC127108 TaxID=3345361 RepID=UPI003643029C
MARERSGPTLAHLVLATRLKILREAAGLSRKQAADALGAHPVTVRRIEQAQTSLDEGQVRSLLGAYGAPDAEIEEYLGKLATANLPGWWHPWRSVMDPWQLDLMSVESATSIIRTWEPALVPALLRTRAYARAVDDALRPDLTAAAKEARTELLMVRQERLRTQHTRIWALMSAVALHTRVGDEGVMAEQLTALRAAAERADVTLQIHPLDGPPHALTGKPAITVYRVEAPEIPDRVVREGGPVGAADIWDAPTTVTDYRLLLDYSCATALHPDKSKEALS